MDRCSRFAPENLYVRARTRHCGKRPPKAHPGGRNGVPEGRRLHPIAYEQPAGDPYLGQGPDQPEDSPWVVSGRVSQKTALPLGAISGSLRRALFDLKKRSPASAGHGWERTQQVWNPAGSGQQAAINQVPPLSCCALRDLQDLARLH
jgi:hypothetical protein